jgi:hypothetical protein
LGACAPSESARSSAWPLAQVPRRSTQLTSIPRIVMSKPHRDPFTWWYSLTEIARRVGKHPRTIRRAMLSGAFGGKPGLAEFPGRQICGEWHFPWPAVACFLGVVPDDGAAISVGWRARSEGELRRKVVQTSGQEVTRG